MVNLPLMFGGNGLTEEGINYSKLGYKPVPDIYLHDVNGKKLNNNIQYKNWCEETFDNGPHIYEAYKNIAFNIKYTPEPVRTDYWQTPGETAGIKRGDCEDAALSFYSRIPQETKNAEIVWGWIINKQTKVGWAHVWYQLTDKKGQTYVVEGFSGDWNGIIPMKIIQETEMRNPFFTISHCMLNRLSNLLPKVDNWKMCKSLVDVFTKKDFVTYVSGNQTFDMNKNTRRNLSDQVYIKYSENPQRRQGQYIQNANYSPGSINLRGLDRKISNILEKLHEVFTRQERYELEIENNSIW